MADETKYIRIPELPNLPHPLGRHIAHDPRSLQFRIMRTPLQNRTIRHRRHGAKLDQGNIGACTGYAAVHCLNSEPFRKTFQKPTYRKTFGHTEAIQIYSEATKIDPWKGSYPPEDTGSNGLSTCKVMERLGLIHGYNWAFGFEDGLRAIQIAPVLQGTYWTEDMFYPNGNGQVVPTGRDAGGHQYLWIGIEMRSKTTEALNRSWFFNSWGAGWGLSGYFWMSWRDHRELLERDGDLVQPTKHNW